MASISEVELAQHAENIRTALGASVQNAIVAGLELEEAKSKIPHGQWGNWLHKELGMNPRTARRFIRSAIRVKKYLPSGDVGKLLGSKSALYRLSEKNVPEEAMEQAVETMQGGTYLTMNLAEGIIRAIEDAGQTAKYLDVVNDRVGAVATFHKVDPEVIPALSRIQREMPDTFDEIEASGCVYDVEGEPIPLEDANKRDVEDYVAHSRFETKMRKNAGNPTTHVMLGFNLDDVFSSGHTPGAHITLFTVDEDGVKTKIPGKVWVGLGEDFIYKDSEWKK